ncbi:MAG: choice-of-anchor I family protein [Bacteroidota bacterium]
MSIRSLLAAALLVAALPAQAQLTGTPIGTYATGVFDEGAAEIAVYDADKQRVYFVNADANELQALDVRDPSTPTLLGTRAFGDDQTATSVATVPGLIAVASAADAPEAPGTVTFLRPNGREVARVSVGALPDAVAFTPDGAYLVVACEGEPADDGSVDPEGSIVVIDVATFTPYAVTFDAFNAGGPRHSEITSQPSIRIYGPGASVAQDLEPEFVTLSPDGATAFVTIQENNAVAVVDIATAVASPGTSDAVTALVGLGFKDWMASGAGLDASDRDDKKALRRYPVFGMYQPDGAAAFEVGGQTYLAVANEGDAREYDYFEEEDRVKDLTLDPDAFSLPLAFLQEDDFLGRLTVTTTLGDPDDDGDYDALYTLGGRSFSIHDASGARIYDSGDGLEQAVRDAIRMGMLPRRAHNANNDDNNSFDSRSDNKGPEPEGVVIGEVGGRLYAFVGLERVSAIAVYDVTTPASATYVTLLSNRNYSVDAESPEAGDLGPEGLAFIAATDSPTGEPILVVSNEVSGTVTLWGLSAGLGPLAAVATSEANATATVSGIAPNPATDAATVSLDLEGEAIASARVFDLLGREVASVAPRALPAGRQRLALDLQGLGSGAYVVRVEAGSAVSTHRLTVIR